MELVFCDECLFNGKQLPNAAWSSKGENLQQQHMRKFEPCMAVVAAISSERGLIHYLMREKSIKAVDFLEFLKELKEKSPNRIVLMLDNASIHKGKACKEFCLAHDIHIVWNVPYQPWYNSQEYFWQHAKKSWRERNLK